MFTISLDPIIFTVGHFAVRWYGLILITAIAVGFWLTAREAARKGFSRDAIFDTSVLIVAGGIAGARLFHVLDHWSHEYAANPVRALYIWEGAWPSGGHWPVGCSPWLSFAGAKAGAFPPCWTPALRPSSWRRPSDA